jgi:dTDP-4-dehydrorhamnose 3,5-epimerase
MDGQLSNSAAILSFQVVGNQSNRGVKQQLEPVMTFHETNVEGAFEIHLEPKTDSRGFFARSWCEREFKNGKMNPKIVQCSLSFNIRKGTLRGLHYQATPHEEAKLVRCTSGAIYDVVVDLRPRSATFKSWAAAVLTPQNHYMLYVPEGCAHGFLTLEDDTEVFYQMSEFYAGESSRGVRWNDPAFGIVWPDEVRVISERDHTYPDFE